MLCKTPTWPASKRRSLICCQASRSSPIRRRKPCSTWPFSWARCTRTELLATANAQAGAAQEKVDRALSILDRRTGDALARVDAAITVTNTAVGGANAQLTSANGTLAGIREDLKPPLQETQTTVKDRRDSWDDLYWDVKASVESATVAARGVAEASEAAGKAAPKLADAAVKNGENIAGITADVHTATSAFVKPKSTWQKIKSALWLVAYGAAHAI